jgi:hypothetical protein
VFTGSLQSSVGGGSAYAAEMIVAARTKARANLRIVLKR